MADLPAVRRNPQIEEFRYKSGVSSSSLQKMGESVVFVNEKQYSTIIFNINGELDSLSTPTTAVDGFQTFEFDVEIIQVRAHLHIGGTSGTTEIDVKRATDPSSTAGYNTKFQSIFSTRPRFTSSSPDFSWIGVGESLTGATAPVLSTTLLNAGDALAFDVISAMAGSNTVSAEVFFRPR